NVLSGALCPAVAINDASDLGSIDVKACLDGVLEALGTTLNMTGVPGVSQICGDGPIRPLNCLLQANSLLAPVTDALGNVPVAGDLVISLVGAIRNFLRIQYLHNYVLCLLR